ncbi:hypothetical protein DSO57_1019305 [Entomophthora muscae]|uniref:Uncharacterized protein n=1 Tax=Entomophthora muscae TaxID=34485 RepID=A0ACC2RV81_9FUNG|nr:hypothetical protein DSO57_1019305 [Entomophthora muscae]
MKIIRLKTRSFVARAQSKAGQVHGFESRMATNIGPPVYLPEEALPPIQKLPESIPYQNISAPEIHLKPVLFITPATPYTNLIYLP